MKGNPLFFFLAMVVVSSCSVQKTGAVPKFSLEKGTTWVYSYDAYNTSAADPTQIINAVYHLTEKVVETETTSQYVLTRLTKKYQLVDSDVGWVNDLASQPGEFWYVVNDSRVFQSNWPLDTGNIKLEELILDYEFPLSISKSWCLAIPNDPNKSISCEVVGKRVVTGQGSYETPAGKFDDCYDLTDYWNTGHFFQKFCSDVGVVYMKFDHIGTRFGFEQILIDYSIGIP